ncbi:hypothetical protein BO79DRAFT_232669 [Aspergillus costaricaensis CBS 115574]|uniref:Uncharacterized protein n=1 Tax=Aspergillus costaricaensis CBS 115574 TaxID=1448317 RepID=A0ACD1I266_9EURO|nr:hypothetical protein BO79DRAFT_232669 [Aspergillus costaricaensis CBS 115574]RAK84141.1 hypothetical protein BO79DRAFT_232669 [Aspergillus costaricaensis CBS 115574]
MGRPSAAPNRSPVTEAVPKSKDHKRTGIDRQAGRRVSSPLDNLRSSLDFSPPAGCPSIGSGRWGCWTSGQQPVGSHWAAKTPPEASLNLAIMFVNHPKSVTAKLRQLQPTSGLANAICIEICERHGYDALFKQVPTSVHANRQLRAVIGALITIPPNGIRNPPSCAKGDTGSSTDGMGYRSLSQVCCAGRFDAKSTFLDQRKWGKRGRKIEYRVGHGTARDRWHCVAVIALQQFMCQEAQYQ